ncbi:MAG: helix-turn-helix transcriptional regulator [Finegoldia magna]|nr:helix-turn-helix transcriptional regulator [Finegoldia magna]
MGFPEEIKRIRQRCFLTQQDFAKKVQVAYSTVNRWEGGKAKPNLITMKNIKEFCHKNDIDYTSVEEAWLDFKAERKPK